MGRLLFLALVGLIAQLVDGSMGMAYGVSSASLLTLAGIAPAVVSATVHVAELVTTALSGLAHWRVGNVRWRLVSAIAIPGMVGAFLGATALSNVPGHLARPYVSVLLLSLGAYILMRCVRDARIQGRGQASLPTSGRSRPGAHPGRPWLLALIGGVAGFADAVGGGGWGPVATPLLLARKEAAPRQVIGSVDTAEFLVTAAASAGFLAARGTQAVQPAWVLALMAGGAVAAPLAAYIVSRMPQRLLAAAVGGMVVLVNLPVVLQAAGLPERLRPLVVVPVGLLGVASLLLALGSRRRRPVRALPARPAQPPQAWQQPPAERVVWERSGR